MDIKISITSFVLSLVLTYIFLPKLKDFVEATSLTDVNYKGNLIPTGMGLTFIFAQILTLGIIQIFFGFNDGFTNIYMLGFVFIGFLGFLDDTVGTDKYKGFKGHIGAFLKGELTTGNIKASLGLFISLVVSSYFSRNYFSLILNGLLIALFINLLNLFDLRPGRASKVYIFLSILLLLLSNSTIYNHIFFSLFGILVVYIPYDLNAELMMGDTGSNILGFTLGVYSMINFNIRQKLIVLTLLIIIHLLAEKVSFSKIIENNKLLNYIDRLGR